MAATGEEEQVNQSESQGAGALSTVHLYYADTELFSNTARVIAVREAEVNGEKLVAIVTDETVMHPQGGGQPTDTGVITSIDGNIRFQVSHVQKPKNCLHIEQIGKYTTNDKQFSVGDEVRIEVDAVRRMLHARLHSAGHLLDSALLNMGMTDLIPAKGYHFPDGPYVEYIGAIPVEKREEVIQKLNREATRLIQEAIPVDVTKNEKGERMVNVGGAACACGGTHVKNTADIRGLTVTKIKKSKKNVRVSYGISEE